MQKSKPSRPRMRKMKERKVLVFNRRTNRYVSVPESQVGSWHRSQEECYGPHCPVPVVPYSENTSTMQDTANPECGNNEDAVPSKSRYEKKKSKRLTEWENAREALLKIDTELRAPPSPVKCILCEENQLDMPNAVRCEDCGPAAFFCQSHYLQHHKCMPFHYPDCWNGKAFVPYMPDMPVLQHFEHDCGCCNRKQKVIVVYGMQGRGKKVMVEFCSCEKEAVTLLRHNLWAASPQSPTTAFHTSLMEWLRVLVLDCQVSVYGFVNALSSKLGKFDQRTSVEITRLYKAIVEDSFWQYMQHRQKMLHVQHISKDLDAGNECPACDTVDAPNPTKIISLDANFGLCRKKSSGRKYQEPFSEQYFVPQEDVDQFIAGYTSKTKKRSSSKFIAFADDRRGTLSLVGRYIHYLCWRLQSGMFSCMVWILTNVTHFKKQLKNLPVLDCSSFRAGNNIRSKEVTDKLDETAVFGSACRHEFPLRFFSLKHGERIGYAVFLMAEIMKSPASKIVVMYDIACVLHSHLKSMSQDTSNDLFRDGSLENVEFVVPIFHSYGHKQLCQLQYGPRRHRGIGLTDGETMERLWSYLRKFSAVTKQMTPERRVDLLSEALLHYAQNLRRNLSRYLYGKKQKAATTRTTSLAHVEKIAATLNVTVSDPLLQKWCCEEEEACKLKQVKGNVGAKDAYILTLCDLYRANRSTSANDGEILRLSEKLKKLQQQHGFLELAEDSQEYQQELLHTVKRKRNDLREALRSVSGERHRTIGQLKEARGQDTAKKLNSCVKKLTNRINKLLEVYNSYSHVSAVEEKASLSFKEVTNGELQCCFEESVMKRRLINAADLVARSREEECLIDREVRASHAWLVKKTQACTQLMEVDNTSRYSKGCTALLFEHAFGYENVITDLERSFGLAESPKPATHYMWTCSLDSMAQNPFPVDADLEELIELEMEEVLQTLQSGGDVTFDCDTDEDHDDIGEEMRAKDDYEEIFNM